ncbi:MAG TPA: hypothetical protein VET88_11415, partial [Gammaproteobacteria bacterium]|nr:hypothetical protein [Gammaproteobacteria bacterium]
AGVLFLIVAVLVLRRLAARPRQPPAAPAVAADPVTAPASADRKQRDAARSALQLACSNNDPQTAARALLQLAAVEWPAEPPRNLEALARRLPAAAGPVRELERALYAAGSAGWQGDKLGQVFANGLPATQPESAPAAPDLAPLYPDWDRQGRET